MVVDLIDYTYLQKRGLIKKEEIKPEGIKITNDGFIDLNNSTENDSSYSSSGGDLLSSLAGASGNTNNVGETAGVLSLFDNVSSNTSSSSVNTDSSLEVQGLKLKIDDLEYKINSLLEKIEQVSFKLLEFEKKAGR
jgi:hypothetical protein